ncbi:hypothetical protein PQQ72_31705 [Paraburkholderia strydomiana]|uniref:hypothetical protein n=1 Tax=Burkholderiaceae TaxID=119060 RepID=UPI0038BD1CC8
MATKQPESGSSEYKNVTLRVPPELKDRLVKEAGRQTEIRGYAVSLNTLIAELCDAGLTELAKHRK